MKSQRGVAEKIVDITERDIKKGLGQGLGVVVSQKMVDKIANLLGEVALDAYERGKKAAVNQGFKKCLEETEQVLTIVDLGGGEFTSPEIHDAVEFDVHRNEIWDATDGRHTLEKVVL